MVKENDDLMAATRYGVMMLRNARTTKPMGKLLLYRPPRCKWDEPHEWGIESEAARNRRQPMIYDVATDTARTKIKDSDLQGPGPLKLEA